MDRLMVAQHLALAESHVAQGERHIARQLEIINELEHKGGDTALANELLRIFEQIQAAHIADRNRLRAELVEG